MKSDLVDIELMIHHQTPAAVLVSLDGDRGRAVWLAKSLVEFEEEPRPGRAQIIAMPQHYATNKGLA